MSQFIDRSCPHGVGIAVFKTLVHSNRNKSGPKMLSDWCMSLFCRTHWPRDLCLPLLSLFASAKIQQMAKQSFCNAVHTLWRSYDKHVALVSPVEDDYP